MAVKCLVKYRPSLTHPSPFTPGDKTVNLRQIVCGNSRDDGSETFFPPFSLSELVMVPEVVHDPLCGQEMMEPYQVWTIRTGRMVRQWSVYTSRLGVGSLVEIACVNF